MSDDPWRPFRERPERAAVLVDFDGTLAAIVADPDAARPLEGVPDLLVELAGRFGLVGVLSGRPIEFLERVLPEGVVLSGIYGLELHRDGRRLDHPEGERWREVIAEVAAAGASGPATMGVEPKGLSVTLHYRVAPDDADAIRAWAADQAARTGLALRAAKMSVELHPPIDADKGTALRDLAEGYDAVCYLGDDLGDLPAFDALDALAAEGVTTLKVAVHSHEAPEQLVARADVVVDGPAGAVAALRALLA